MKRHPFDVEILQDRAGCNAVSASLAFRAVGVLSRDLRTRGSVRHEDDRTAIEAGDAFIFGPGEAHQLINDGTEDLIIYVVADNPIGESAYYPDSKKWLVRSPERRLMRGEALDYFDGEE